MRTLENAVRKATLVTATTVTAVAGSNVDATWSIVMTDSRTNEVAVGTVTCLNNFDLLAIVPVVVVGKGAAAVQAAGDFEGVRRPIIFDHLQKGTDPEIILEILSQISGHDSRQYGIADTQGRMITFTGRAANRWAGGVIGNVGSMVYAIQGNILAGGCVVPAIEDAILSTPGDMAEKLMAGMEAAYLTGGDGRCSCDSCPTCCGCPPANFDKSGHIGCMVVARIGDTDDNVCNSNGCADGDYFMSFNVPFQQNNDPDPVFQLRDMFNAWRTDLVGRPDALQSIVLVIPPFLPPDGASPGQILIDLRDWRNEPISVPVESITVEHTAESDRISTIGEVVDLGGGEFAVQLTAGSSVGVDRFRIVVDDGIRPVTLMPGSILPHSNLTTMRMFVGELLEGVEFDLMVVDDRFIRTRSGFGETVSELHKMDILIDAETTNESPVTMDVVARSRVDQPAGRIKIAFRSLKTGDFETVGQGPISSEYSTIEIRDIDATEFINSAGRMRMSLKHVVFVPFLGFTFESFLDLLEIHVN